MSTSMTLRIVLCLQNWICRILELKTLFTHLHVSCCFVAVRSWGNQMRKVASPFSLSMSLSHSLLRLPSLPPSPMSTCPLSCFFFLLPQYWTFWSHLGCHPHVSLTGAFLTDKSSCLPSDLWLGCLCSALLFHPAPRNFYPRTPSW